MRNRCECGHHRLTHTYTREGNVGPCEGYQPLPGANRLLIHCECETYEPADTEEES